MECKYHINFVCNIIILSEKMTVLKSILLDSMFWTFPYLIVLIKIIKPSRTMPQTYYSDFYYCITVQIKVGSYYVFATSDNPLIKINDIHNMFT